MGSSDVFFRFGGDEFILVSREKSVESIEAFWDSVITKFEHFNASPQAPNALSVSLGFIEHRKGSRLTVEELLEHADKEMYKEKQRYKQQLSF